MTEKSFKRFLVSVLCFCLAVLAVIASPIALAAEGEEKSEASAASEKDPSEEEYRNQISDLQDEQIKIQQEMKDYNNKINGIKDNKKKQQAIINTIDEKISITEKAIAVGLEKIDLTNKYIAEKNREIARKDKEIENTLQLFRDRMRAIYMTGGYSDSTNALVMLLSSSNVTEFLARNEYLERIAEHDREIVIELRDELAVLEKEKAKLEEEKAALEEEKAALEKEQKELEEQRKVAKSSMQDLFLQQEQPRNFRRLHRQKQREKRLPSKQKGKDKVQKQENV